MRYAEADIDEFAADGLAVAHRLGGWRPCFAAKMLRSLAGNDQDDAASFSVPETAEDALDLDGLALHGGEALAHNDGVADGTVEEVFEVALNDG
jgi:hypothetical protein